MAHDTVKSIPILFGTETYSRWTRAIEAYLLDQGSLRALQGFEPEPYRRLPTPAIPNDLVISRGLGTYAPYHQV